MKSRKIVGDIILSQLKCRQGFGLFLSQFLGKNDAVYSASDSRSASDSLATPKAYENKSFAPAADFDKTAIMDHGLLEGRKMMEQMREEFDTLKHRVDELRRSL